MRREVVEDDPNPLRPWIVHVHEILHALGEVESSPLVGHLCVPPRPIDVDEHEDVRGAIPHVLVVEASTLAWFGAGGWRQRRGGAAFRRRGARLDGLPKRCSFKRVGPRLARASGRCGSAPRRRRRPSPGPARPLRPVVASKTARWLRKEFSTGPSPACRHWLLLRRRLWQASAEVARDFAACAGVARFGCA